MVRKFARDAQIMSESARFVIRIGKDGIVSKQDNHPRMDGGLPIAYIIVVIAYISYEGLETEAVVLEMGCHRHRPYAQIENRKIPDPSGRRRWSIKPRLRIPESVFNPEKDVRITQEVYGIICDCMADMLLECREPWNYHSKQTVFYRGEKRSIEFERGIFFSVDRSDEWLYRQMLLEHMRYMHGRSLYQGHIGVLRRWIGKYKELHSWKKLRLFAGALSTARLIGHYACPVHQAALLYYLEGRVWLTTILVHVCQTLGVWMDKGGLFPVFDDEGSLQQQAVDISVEGILKLLKKSYTFRLPFMQHTRVYYHRKRKRVQQGRGRFVFEVIPTRAFLREREIPF